jgi:hypothetical protein
VQLGRHHALGKAELEAERDQALLGAVVQVPLDPPPGLIRGRDDSRPGGGQLGPALRIPDGGRDQLRKVRHAVSGAGGNGPRLVSAFTTPHSSLIRKPTGTSSPTRP